MPRDSGDRIRNFHLIRQLAARDWVIDVVAAVHDERDRVQPELRELCRSVAEVPLHRSAWGTRLSLLRDLLTGQPYAARRYHSEKLRERVSEAILDAQPDVVVMSQLYTASWLDPATDVPRVLDAHNHETRRFRLMAHAGAPATRIAARLQAGAVERVEADTVRGASMTLSVSQDEAAAFETWAPGRVRIIPNGVDLHRAPVLTAPPRGSAIAFLGSLDYRANIEAIQWFASNVGPLVRTPQWELRVVGSRPGPRVRATLDRAGFSATLHADVPDPATILRDCRLLVVPLRTGGGTRLKVLEAMALGLPVVSTTVGCEGIGARDGEHLLVADDPVDFAAQIDSALGDDARWVHLSQSALAFVAENFRWDAIGDRLDSALREVLSRATSEQGAAAARQRPFLASPGSSVD